MECYFQHEHATAAAYKRMMKKMIFAIDIDTDIDIDTNININWPRDENHARSRYLLYIVILLDGRDHMQYYLSITTPTSLLLYTVLLLLYYI